MLYDIYNVISSIESMCKCVKNMATAMIHGSLFIMAGVCR